ncbi:hypothetical protein ACF5W4_09300 [Bacillota bacterium Lsc_1132]
MVLTILGYVLFLLFSFTYWQWVKII